MTSLTPEARNTDPLGAGHPQAESAVRGLARSLLRSRAWWVIPLLNEASVELATAIACRYYAADVAGRDWLVILTPPTVFARKTPMPPAALATLLADLSPVGSEAAWRAGVEEQDILATVQEGDQDAETIARLAMWHAWLVAA